LCGPATYLCELAGVTIRGCEKVVYLDREALVAAPLNS